MIKAGSRILRRIVDYQVDAAFLPARVHVPAIHLAELLGDWCRPIVVLPQSKSAYVCKGLSMR